MELVPTNRLINNLSLAYNPNGNGTAATVSVAANGWPASGIFFDNASNYSAVMGQAATATAQQGIELNNLRVANAGQLGQYGECEKWAECLEKCGCAHLSFLQRPITSTILLENVSTAVR